nr:hypothetical protein [Abalone asfa-like virus]
MVVLYDIAGGYWLAITIINNITPQIDKDFIIIDQNRELSPSYYVTISKTLYILIESPVLQGIALDLYLQNTEFQQVLMHNQTTINPFDSDQFPIGIHLNGRQTPSLDPKNIEKILNETKSPLPSLVKNRFLEKYLFTPTSLLSLTNG